MGSKHSSLAKYSARSRKSHFVILSLDVLILVFEELHKLSPHRFSRFRLVSKQFDALVVPIVYRHLVLTNGVLACFWRPCDRVALLQVAQNVRRYTRGVEMDCHRLNWRLVEELPWLRDLKTLECICDLGVTEYLSIIKKHALTLQTLALTYDTTSGLDRHPLWHWQLANALLTMSEHSLRLTHLTMNIGFSSSLVCRTSQPLVTQSHTLLTPPPVFLGQWRPHFVNYRREKHPDIVPQRQKFDRRYHSAIFYRYTFEAVP